MKNKYLLCAITVLLCSGLHAQYIWKDTGPLLFPANISGQINGIGRVTQIRFSPVHSNRMYACASTGGLWISNNSGATWSVTGTDTLPAMGTSAICIDYTNDNILYLSSGDPNYYYPDFGIWKSADGGASWALANSGIGSRMALGLIMSPANNNVLVAATNDGIWKTTNAGATWVETKSGGMFTDMKLKAAPNSQTLFACTIDQLWRSTDMGSTWQQITNGINMPADSIYSGCRIAVTAADSNRIYFMTNKDQGTVWRSTDGGASFSQVYHNPVQSLTGYDASGGGQGNYNFCLVASPDSANVLYTASHCVWRSTDGGFSWMKMTDWYAILHTDMHDFCFDPQNHHKLFNANDGGVWYTTDAASNWTESSDSLRNTEIYHSAQSRLVCSIMSAGTQDNGELMYNNNNWYCNRGGDWTARCDFDYLRPGTVYYFDAGARRDIVAQGSDQDLVLPFSPDGITRMAFSSFNNNVGFASQEAVYRTTTLQNDTPVWSLLINVSRPVMALATSPADSDLLYFITNNGRFYRSNNATAASPAFVNYALPATPQVRASIAPVKSNHNMVYVAADSKVYRSVNAGNTFTNVTANLPPLNIVKIIHDENSTDESVYVAMGSSVYYKNISMANWQNISQGLPSIANISDFTIYNDGTACSKLRVAYYGRGVWENDLLPNVKPVVNAAVTDTLICPGSSVPFNYTQCGTVDSVTWYFTGGTPAVSGADSPVVTYAAAGIYPAVLIGHNQFGNDTSVVHIHVTPAFAPPLVQGFELAVFPPVNFKLVNRGTNTVYWKRTTTTGGYGASNAAVLFDNYNNDTQGERDQLWTQRINLDSLLTAQLTFDYAYAPWGGSCSYPDSLRVLISTDCGQTQTVLFAQGCTGLATAPNIEDSLFIPLPNQWRTDTINLNSYIGNPDAVIIFENLGHYGQGIYIDNINIQGYAPLKPVIAFTASSQNICAGDTVQFTDQSTNQPNQWQWVFNQGSPATSTLAAPRVVYDSAGTYPVTLTATNSYGSNTQTFNNYITVNALPQQPVVSRNGNVLQANSSPGGSYQWYLNGQLIAGANAATYTPVAEGIYTVVLTGTNGCTSVSAPFQFTLGGITVTTGNFITISPNPGNGMFTLSTGLTGPGTISIQNALGQQILTYPINPTSGLYTQNINLSSYGAGVYLVTVTNDGKQYIKKVVIQ